MMKIAAIALLASASAQQGPEITSAQDGGLLVSRRQTTRVSDIDVRIAEAVGQAQVAAERAAFNATLTATMTMTSSMNSLQTGVAAQIAAMQASLEATTTSLNSQMAVQTSNIASQMAAQESAAVSRATALENTVAASTGELSTAVAGALAGSLQRTTASMTALNVSLLAAMSNKMTAKKHMWSGGCSASKHGGWGDICLDRVELDTARPKFMKRTNTRMRALVTGIYKTNSFFINESCNWAHSSFMVAGSRKTHTHLHTSGWWWKDQNIHYSAKVNAGQDFWNQVHAGCGRNAAHPYGVHQKQQFEWTGNHE